MKEASGRGYKSLKCGWRGSDYNGSIERDADNRRADGSEVAATKTRMEGCQVSEGAVTKRDKYAREYTDFDVAHNLCVPWL